MRADLPVLQLQLGLARPTDEALRDRDAWNRVTCPEHPGVLAVVANAGGIPRNALEITERGEGICGRVEKVDALPLGLSHWGHVSFYLDSNFPNETVVLGAPTPQLTLLGLRKDDGDVRVFLRARFDAAGQPLSEPEGVWTSSQVFAPQTFVRYEWRFERVTSTTFRVWPRSPAVFTSWAPDGGRVFLEDWYDAGNAFGLVSADAGDVRTVSIGTDGPPVSTDGGGRWYITDFELSDEGWLP